MTAQTQAMPMKGTRTRRNLHYPRRTSSSHTPNEDGRRKGRNETSSRPRLRPKNANSTTRVRRLHPTWATPTPIPKPKPKGRARPRSRPQGTVPDVKNAKTRYGSGTCLFGRLKTPSGGSLMALGRSRGFICRCDVDSRSKARTWGAFSSPFFPHFPSVRLFLRAVLYTRIA